MTHAPTFLSLFAGIGGFDLALEKAGFRCVGQVEIDPFCTRVLADRFLCAPRWADVREWQGDGHEPLDLLVGGFPCQDFSVAGKRKGLVGYRGTLFWEIVRIAKAVKPTWGLFENVPGLVSSHSGRDFWAVLQSLRECWPAVGWRILDSRHFGVAQRRRRVFLVCGPSEAAVASVLFESEGGSGHLAAGGEAGADLAHALARGTSRSSTGRGTPIIFFNPRQLRNSESSNQVGIKDDGLADALNTDGPGAVGFAQNQRGEVIETDYAHQLTAGGGKPGEGYPVTRVGATVRRLTPMECERLQAFPDGWTCLCEALEAYAADPEEAAWRCRCPDGPRYRALGNAVTVSVVEWIGRRLALATWEEGK